MHPNYHLQLNNIWFISLIIQTNQNENGKQLLVNEIEKRAIGKKKTWIDLNCLILISFKLIVDLDDYNEQKKNQKPILWIYFISNTIIHLYNNRVSVTLSYHIIPFDIKLFIWKKRLNDIIIDRLNYVWNKSIRSFEIYWTILVPLLKLVHLFEKFHQNIFIHLINSLIHFIFFIKLFFNKQYLRKNFLSIFFTVFFPWSFSNDIEYNLINLHTP